MRKLITLTLLAIATWSTAQERKFVIRGEMSSPVLCYSDETIKEVRLDHLVDGQPVVVATVPVEDGKFVIEGIAPETLGLYNITGFDNGSIQVFVEEGEIKVGPFDAAYPVGAKVGGTPSNDIYQAYLDLNSQCIKEAKARMKAAQAVIPDEVKGDPVKEMEYTSPTFYVNNIHFKVAFMDFIYHHLDSPVALYIIKFSMVPTFTTDVIQTFLDAVPQDLRKLPIYKELVNEVRAANLKVGAEAPDISGLTPEGEEVNLKEKYTLENYCAIPMYNEDDDVTEEYTNYVVSARRAYAAKITESDPSALIFFVAMLLLALLLVH